jgi:hypothetical protein
MIMADFVRRSPPIEKPTSAKASVGEGGERGKRAKIYSPANQLFESPKNTTPRMTLFGDVIYF